MIGTRFDKVKCSEADVGPLQAVNYYHNVLHLGCCSRPRSASDVILITFAQKNSTLKIPGKKMRRESSF